MERNKDMNRTLMRIRAHYSEMGKSEKKVADYILENPSKVSNFSIRELSKETGSSEATIVRFSKRMGSGGYQSLRLDLANLSDNDEISPYIEETDDCYDIFTKICADIYLSLERTKNTLSPENMGKAADAILDAGRVVLIGLGSSASVASDASDKFLRAGCNSMAYSDTHMQMIAVANLKKNDVLIGISQSGSSKDIVDAMKVGKERGAVTIAITSKDHSPIAKVSDIVLLTDTEEVRHFSQGFASHLSRRLVTDALVYRVVQKTEGVHRAEMEEATASLETKRLQEN